MAPRFQTKSVRPCATAGFLFIVAANGDITDDEFPNDDFFPDVNDLFSDMTIGTSTSSATASTAEQRARRVTMREHISSSFMDSPPRFHMPFHDADLLHSGRHRHAHPYDRTDEEELLALEDRIGYVSTGLREDEIVRGLRVGKHPPFDRKHFSTETERSCSICQV
uniref:RING-type E3 ubiquitin transferase n=1 Tax=Aegilops tauschii TaxID=37682 RepID=M8CEQ7_AEGTA